MSSYIRIPERAVLFRKILSRCRYNYAENNNFVQYILMPIDGDMEPILNMKVGEFLQLEDELANPYIMVNLVIAGSRLGKSLLEDVTLFYSLPKNCSGQYLRISLATIYKLATVHLLLDLYPPDGSRQTETVLFLGEYWTRSDKIKKVARAEKVMSLDMIENISLLDLFSLFLDGETVRNIVAGIDQEINEDTEKMLKNQILGGCSIVEEDES